MRPGSPVPPGRAARLWSPAARPEPTADVPNINAP